MAITFLRTNGVVGTGETTVISAVSETSVIFSMAFNNTDASTRNLKVWLKAGASARKILEIDVEAGATLIVDSKHTLLSGDSVTAQSAAALTDFWVSYVEMV